MVSPSVKTRFSARGFTIAEVCVAIGVCALFAAAAFTTNERLLVALKSQKETTAATMALQQRMEQLRATSFSNIGTPTYVQSAIIANPTGSETPLGNLTETITVSAYDPTATTPAPASGTTSAVIVRNSTNPSGVVNSSGSNLTSTNLMRVDVVLDWLSANSRPRERQLSTVIGIGNIAP